MKKCLFQLILIVIALTCLPTRSEADDPPSTPVFEAGNDGYKVFRIPAIIAADNGDLLAFCEARQGGDASETDIVLKRSSDNGKTWGSLEVVQESDDFRSLFDPDETPPITIGNPAPVVDRLGPKHPGRIWLPFTLENDRVFVTYSDDNGKTWADRREITNDVKREGWGWYATGPVHSIQLQRAPHRGRLVVPCDHRIGEKGKDRGVNGAHVIYSDDGGSTWQIGAVDDTYEDGLNANETTVVELNDGSLYFNTRDQNGKAPGTRGEAWSRDGGLTFESRSKHWKQFRPVGGTLDPPVVQSALLRFDPGMVLFSGPDDNGPTGKGRSDMQIRFSTDEAETWQDGPLIHTGPAAYSDMVAISENAVGVLFEAGMKGAYESIRFTAIERSDINSNHRVKTDFATPNILFIVSEDNSDQIGCYGDTRVHTPHLDSLAASGVKYTRAYVPYSVCSPSRAAFLTGLYTRQTGHIGLATHRFAFYKHFKTMPAYLQEVGYYTGFIGKTHLNPESIVEDYIDFRGVKHANFNNTHSIENYAQEARTIFENANKAKKPFLAIINYSDAHRKFIRKSKAGYPTVQVEGDIPPLPWIGCDTPKLRDEMRNYLNCMNRLDEGIGLVLAELEKTGQRDDTFIVYMADHGGDFPRGKTTCYEGGVKVPLIVNYPKSFPKGHTEDAMVSTMDILPSILKEAGIDIPGELVGTPLQALQAPDTPRRKYIHTFNTGSAASLLFLTFGIRDGNYKLIYNPIRAKNLAAISRYKNTNIPFSVWDPNYIDPPEFELYDLSVDPHEFTNLANDPELHEKRNHLYEAMRAFQKEIGDPFLDPENVKFFIEEMSDTARQPKKRSEEVWSHLEKFYGRSARP